VEDRLSISNGVSHTRAVEEVKLMAPGSPNVVALVYEERQKCPAENTGATRYENSHSGTAEIRI
jgi:hypothetical protein